MDVETLYQTWYEHLERYFTTCVGLEDAQDLTHDLFIRYLNALARGTEIDDPMRWLWRAARNLMVDQLRLSRVRPTMKPMDDAELVPAHDDSMARLEERLDRAFTCRGAMHCLDALPNAQQQVIVLRFWNDWRYGQVADALGISSGAARVRGSRALRQMAAFMTR